MSYQSINARKEEFRKYLEKNGVVDSFTKALVALYEEPERPQNPLEYVKHYLGGPSTEDIEQLKQENEKLKQRIKELEEGKSNQ
ncbi:hypothetical protein C9374_009332 [Naegleria lovaniensis]|uniref:c-Myc-binding protein n=1 Tax=Naegleria lovaniensis TaxID=51637 RepID=A0AA88GJ23_NAELO|nr:uncharacterized protein C9374_009332 [Naegleria lovaniensis]KAG2377421.1 hypothetical protein C9374_009332 [Naegleria lovaniensis]